MSYDLAVFDPSIAPIDQGQFMIWFEDQMSSSTIEDHESPDNLSLVLKSWFLDMRMHYPPLNPPDENYEVDDSKMSEYYFCPGLVYVSFAWSQSESASALVFKLAKKHKIGFYNVSSSPSEVWLPVDENDYKCAFKIAS